MEVPVGFIAKLWSFFRFLPFFILLLLLGTLKALVISPVAAGIIGVGNSAVIIGLWPAHFIWTCYCVARTKKLGMILKILVLLSLPGPLFLWPIVGILGSFLGGIGFGFFAPLLATFEAVGANVTDKFYHCFVDGCWPTITGSCTVVRDFTDFCFHSYFSYMDELSMKMCVDEKPSDIKLSRLPGSLLIAVFALVVDVPSISALALWKSPYMLFTGWKRLLEDLVGREGPFLETICIPFAGLAIILWPLAVVGAVIAAFLSSFFLGLYAGVIVHQENSIKMGLAYIVAIVSQFDEYANDLLYLTEGSCLPSLGGANFGFGQNELVELSDIHAELLSQVGMGNMRFGPRYRKRMNSAHDAIQRKTSYDGDRKEGLSSSKLVSERSRTLKDAIQHYKPIRVLDWLFKSCEVNGRRLLHDGLIDVKDIEECLVKGDCKKLGIVLPAWCILKCLLASAKSDSPGLVISDEADLMISDLPRDKMFHWFIGPLLIMQEQIRKMNLDENEEACLRQAVMQCKYDIPEDWDDLNFPSKDPVRRAQLQSVIRRLQGMVGSMARMPTFRRRFQELVKMLYVESAKTGALIDYVVEKSSPNEDRKVVADRENSDEHHSPDIV